MTKRLLLFALIGMAVLAEAQDPGEKKQEYTAEASFVNANGNSKSMTVSVKNSFIRRWDRTSLELKAGGLGSQSAGVNVAEQYFGEEKGAYKLDERNYVFERFKWDKDRFAGIAHRYDGSVGLGREFMKTPRHLFSAEVGGGYINEQRTPPPRNDFASGRAFAKYQWTFSETANFLQTAEYIANFEDGDDLRFNSESSLTAALSENFSLKTSFTWKHVGQPPVGFGRNDTLTSVALVASY